MGTQLDVHIKADPLKPFDRNNRAMRFREILNLIGRAFCVGC